jgi:transcriptional regulator of arginine metabolism
MKSKRQDEIIEIISSADIETQEELAMALREKGYQVTQATVSRDIRELRLIKVASKSGGYKYAKPVRHEIAVSERLTRILADSLVHVETASNLTVVKTLSGSANIAAEALDNLGWKEIIGTIAGDNTVFIAAKSEDDADAITNRIRKMTDSN